MPQNLSQNLKQLEDNIHIINGINDRKSRLPNTHLLTSLLCGHYTKWMSTLYQKGRVATKCCPFCQDYYWEYNYMKSGDCVCNLAIPGQVPMEAPTNELHFEFLRFLNKLASHEMFEGYKKDPPYPIPDNTSSNYFEQDGSNDCIVA